MCLLKDRLKNKSFVAGVRIFDVRNLETICHIVLGTVR